MVIAEMEDVRRQRDALRDEVELLQAELADLSAAKAAIQASLSEAVTALTSAAEEVEEQEADLTLAVERSSLFLRRGASAACADDAQRTARLMQLLQSFKVLI